MVGKQHGSPMGAQQGLSGFSAWACGEGCSGGCGLAGTVTQTDLISLFAAKFYVYDVCC